MVLFGKNALTKAYLLSNRAFSRTSSNNFNYFIKEVQKPFKTEVAAVHNKSTTMWRNIFILVGIPALALININLMFFEDHHPKRPEFHPYEHMRKRSRKFPWGDGNHSLFHNPYYNALPDGYETEEDDHSHGGH